MPANRPKIGLALSGASGRAVAHIGILEVFKEHNIPVDIVVGCSSGAMVTASYGAETMDVLKDFFMKLSHGKVWKLWGFWGSRGGLFHLRKPACVQEFTRLTRGLRLEQLPMKIGFTAADVETGELITITSGDMFDALKATTAVPGLLEPIVIGNRILVDGGLVNIVPTIPVKQLGADIVIGVDIAITKFLYQRKMPIWRVIRRIRRMFGIHYLQHGIIQPLTSKIIDQMEKQLGIKKRRVPNSFRILSWAVDHSFDIEKEWNEEKRAADMMIEPKVKHFGKIGINDIEVVYREGRRAAEEAIPAVKKLIEDWQIKHQIAEQERMVVK